MRKRSIPALILTVLSGYCGAGDSVGSNSHQRNKPYSPDTSFSYDIVQVVPTGGDLLVHLKSIRDYISQKTTQSGGDFSGSGSGSDSGSVFYFDLDINRATGRATEKNNHFESMLIKLKHPNAIIPLNSDDEDYISFGSGADEVQTYSGIKPSEPGRLKTAMLLLKPSDTPYVMSGSIDISDFSLTICSLAKKLQDSPGVEDDKPVNIKLNSVLSPASSDRSDVKPRKAWFSVTGKGELSIAGVFLNAFETKENFPIIYADGKSQVNIDRSDILRTTSEPENIVHSNRSLIVVRRGTQVPGISITHSRLYSNLHKGSIIKSTPVPLGIDWTRKERIVMNVSNSYFYVPDGEKYFDVGRLTDLTRKHIRYYHSATPDHYKYFAQTSSNNPLKLFCNHDVYSDMADNRTAVSSELSGLSPFQQSNSAVQIVKAGFLPVILPFVFAWF